MCGNLGLLLVGHDGDAPPEALLEEMARVVAMRGAQSYGFVAAAGGKSMTMHKAVLTKRDDIAAALRRAVRRRVGARALATRPLLLAAHLRFATSSRSTAVEAHPHSWLGPVAALPPSAPGAPPPKPTRRLVAITHNGDFEGLDVGRCFGCDLPVMALDALRAWLAVRLGRAPPSTGDSCVASGALELLFAAGDCADGLTDHKSSSWFEGRSGVVAVMRRRRKASASIVEGTRAKSWLRAMPPKAGPRSS